MSLRPLRRKAVPSEILITKNIYSRQQNQPCFFCSISRNVVHHEEEEGRFHGSAKFQFFSYISPPLEVKARCLELNFQGKKIISSVYAQAKIWRDWSGRKVFFYLFLGQHNTAEFSLAFFLASENPKH